METGRGQTGCIGTVRLNGLVEVEERLKWMVIMDRDTELAGYSKRGKLNGQVMV